MNTENGQVLVIIPTYSERENLEALVKAVFSGYSGADIFAVDDNSPDGTGELLDSLKNNYPRLNVVHRPVKMGIGSAHLLGLQYAAPNAGSAWR